MALIKRDYVCSHLRHYVERYILSCDVCQAAKSRRVDTARMPRPLPVPNTKWHCVSIDWVSGLPPTTRGHDAIMTVVDRLSKRGMFIPCRKDMTADNLVYVFLREVVPLTGCPQQIVLRSRQAVRVPSVEGVGSAFQDRDAPNGGQPSSRQWPSGAQQPVDPSGPAYTRHLW